MQFIVLDLEATCWQGYTPDWRQEVIEIGAFKVTSFGEAIDSFHLMVKPTEHPSLSAYCTELTGIAQQEVEHAPQFPQAKDRFMDWIALDIDDFHLCSWGSKDALILKEECEYHHIDTDWLEEFKDIKHHYHRLKRLNYKQGLVKTLDKEGIPYEGELHRALSDAENLCRLFSKYIDEWQF